MMLHFLRRCLENAGYEVETWSPISAMEIPGHLAISIPDLILSDYVMPGVSGASVARMAYEATPQIPVIVLTSMRDEEKISKLLKLGVKQVLIKPITPSALVQSVKNAIESPGMDI